MSITATFNWSTHQGDAFLGSGEQLGPTTSCKDTNYCASTAIYNRTPLCDAGYTFYDHGTASATVDGYALPPAEGAQKVGGAYNPPGADCNEPSVTLGHLR